VGCEVAQEGLVTGEAASRLKASTCFVLLSGVGCQEMSLKGGGFCYVNGVARSGR
jgi:hypothetical protein